MISIPSNQPSQQDQTVTILRTQLAKAQTRIQSLEARLKWEDELFANPHLSPGHKLALRATVNTVRKATSEPETLTKIYIPAIAEKIGLSAKTVGKNLQFLADTGALTRETETDTDRNGQKITRVFIGLTDQVKRPAQIIPPQPRNHGGYREHCPACGSENLLEEKKIICTDCGTVISTTQKIINQEPTGGQLDRRSEEEDPQVQNRATEQNTTPSSLCMSPSSPSMSPTDNLTPLLKPKTPTDNLTGGEMEKPPTPPIACAACSTIEPGIITLPVRQEQEHTQPREAEQQLERAAMLLLDIAGDSPEHISMPGENGKKYKTIHRPLTLLDMRDHLTGRKIYGATLQTGRGTTTRALCLETDEKPTDTLTWRELQDAATLLIAEGYKPILEPSPAGRGGHLWLIFSDRVNTKAAYSQVVSIAPQLAAIGEYWPSGRNQKVRLPAGRYVTPTFSSWTTIIDADREENAKNQTGLNRLTILLSNLTPATLIPETEPEDQPAPGLPATPRTPSAQRQPHTLREPDEQHRRKYGDHKMWVAWPDEQFLIDRYNATHSIDDLAQPERNGMINAGQIGRPERTASVGVTRDGQRFTDFGAGAKQPDGHQDGGDPFEFYIRSHNLEKSEELRKLGRELNRAASSEILRAARAGEPLPAWVMDIITPTGRAVYTENAGAASHQTLEEHTGG